MMTNYPAMASCFTEINRRENKAQIPLIIHHNEKNKEYIYDVQQKIIELHKLVKWL